MEIDKTLAFDCGAFTGDTIPMIRGLGYNKIVCFEPHPGNFQALMNNYGTDPNIIKVNKAISSESGLVLRMFVNHNLPWLNTVESNWIFNTRHEQHYQDRSECQVGTITLDSYIEELGVIPDYIKIDVEGHELELFKGFNYKPNKLSFEFITEFPEKNILGLIKMKELGFTKFNICFCEATPQPGDQIYDFEGVVAKMVEIRKSDTKNEIWGNFWCQ